MTQPPNQTPSAPPTRSILLVDDEPNLLQGLARAFHRFPQWRVHLAHSGEEGLALLAKTPIEAVVSDMRMPCMTGAEFLDEVGRRYPGIRRVMLTGSVSGEVVPSTYPVFYKPCRIESLISALD